MPNRIPTPQEVGELLRRFRRRAELTQEEVAARAGLTLSYVGRVERGERRPTVEVVSRILRASGADWTEMGEALEAASSHPD